MSNKNLDLFGEIPQEQGWESEWQNMPEYSNVNEPPPVIIATFKFKSEEDYNLFNELIKKHLYNNEKVFDGMQKKDKKTAWFPARQKTSKYKYI